MAAHIRLAHADDAREIARIYRPFVESTVISFEIAPPDAEQMRDRITETLARYPWLVCELGGRVAGYAYATEHRARKAYQWSIDVSVYVHPDYWRLGIGRGLYTSLFAITTAQRFVNAYAGIALPNAASVALHESVGFKPVGVYQHVGYKLGAWHDVGWWQMGLKARPASPEEPLGLGAVRNRPEWESLLATGLSVVRSG